MVDYLLHISSCTCEQFYHDSETHARKTTHPFFKSDMHLLTVGRVNAPLACIPIPFTLLMFQLHVPQGPWSLCSLL